jgi:hypothetical protein
MEKVAQEKEVHIIKTIRRTNQYVRQENQKKKKKNWNLKWRLVGRLDASVRLLLYRIE